MARKSSPWRINIDRSKCEYAFFVSHVAEDLAEVQLFAEVLSTEFDKHGGLPLQTCFLDVDDWDLGNPPKPVLKKKVAASQFFLGWVTPQYLEHARRGWVWFELAYAELIELSQQPTLEIEFPFIVPIFRNTEIAEIARTPWHDFLPREIERGVPHESIEDYLKRLVPRLVAYYRQEMSKWAAGK